MDQLRGILAHRGLWRVPAEHNTLEAFDLALKEGFGIELDVRDAAGRLVVSHDPPLGAPLPLEEVFRRIAQSVIRQQVWLALNIKSDGLERFLCTALSDWSLLDRSFVFDLSVPSMIAFYRMGRVRMATRCSDCEPQPALTDYCSHVWIDGFERDWERLEYFSGILFRDKTLVFVSPELHGRDPEPLWTRLRESSLEFLLCTDRPHAARAFFAHAEGALTHGITRPSTH